jgi:glycosyltransferase involved in cell wall biosynthesis
VPVVAAAAGALPETCGAAALLVEPGDHEGFAAAAVTAATDSGERQRLIGLGLERARGRTWQRAAELTDAAIAPLLTGG